MCGWWAFQGVVVLPLPPIADFGVAGVASWTWIWYNGSWTSEQRIRMKIVKTPGKVIAIEGLDGSGKTTLAQGLIRRFASSGWRLIKYPTDVARRVESSFSFSPASLQLMMAGDRAAMQGMMNQILEAGNNILCDRYKWSGYAYGIAGGLDPKWLETIDRYSIDPDYVIYVDIDPSIALQRVMERDRELPLNFDPGLFRAVYQAYETLIIDTDIPVARIDGSITTHNALKSAIEILKAWELMK